MQEKTLLKQKHRTSNIHSSEFGAISYDIFGSPYQKTGSFLADDSLDFGYLGKPYNADTELYDYGFRDYSPEIARFSTVDPIRDGRNWYCYVVNDPVDLWGLCGSDGATVILITSGHGYTNNGVQTSDKQAFTPKDLESIEIGEKLKLVIFENCYQGDLENEWEAAFGNGIDVVGWKGETSVFETIMFNTVGIFDKQKMNLAEYLSLIFEIDAVSSAVPNIKN